MCTYCITGIFRGEGGQIFRGYGIFWGSWEKNCGYVYACTNGRGSLHLW